MRLSEVIMLGSIATVQGFGDESFTSDHAPCALGAARFALGISARSLNVANYSALIEKFPFLKTVVQFPDEETQGKYGDSDLIRAIWCLNDFCKWPREKIADWVASIEPSTETAEVEKVQAFEEGYTRV